MNLLKAKQAIETLLDDREVVVNVPIVEDSKVLIADLAESGIEAVRVDSQPASSPRDPGS
jgi:hypothetical protein